PERTACQGGFAKSLISARFLHESFSPSEKVSWRNCAAPFTGGARRLPGDARGGESTAKVEARTRGGTRVLSTCQGGASAGSAPLAPRRPTRNGGGVPSRVA